MDEYKGIFKAFTDYCYDNVDQLEWKSFRNKDISYHYYRTRIKDLNLIVGLNLEMDTYFLSIKGLGDIGNQKHRALFPSKLQRLFFTLYRLEEKYKHEKPTEEPSAE